MNWVAFFQIAIGIPVMIAGAMGLALFADWVDERLGFPWGLIIVGGSAILFVAAIAGLTAP